MKQALIFTFILMLSLNLVAEDQKHHDQSQTNSHEKADCELKAGQECTKISIPTAQCGMCEKSITTALQAVAGTQVVKVDAKAKTAHVHFDTQNVKLADLEKAIAAAGYDANNTLRDETVHASLPQCCKMER